MHTLRKLQEWKATFAPMISDWLEVIGEIEAINSLSNFAYNNPTYTYPNLNSKEQLYITLSHLIVVATHLVLIFNIYWRCFWLFIR